MLVACGGDDDEDEAPKTTTRTSAAATGTKPEGSGGGGSVPAGEFATAAKSGIEKLRADLRTLNREITAAQLTRDDPGTDKKLKDAIGAVEKSAKVLRDLKVPSDQSSFGSELNKALDKVDRVTKAMTKAVDTGVDGAGAEGFFAIGDANSALDDLAKKLPQ
jgi:hypothetical protein